MNWIGQIRSRMDALGISIAQTAAYTGVGSNRLSPFLAGQKDLDGPTLQHIYRLLISLEELQQLASDWPLDFSNIKAVKRLLERARTGELESAIPRRNPSDAVSA